MEFNQKLQELRKQKGLTQEELADALFVSRTAVSKWESGRGYPSIDSLKAISAFFSVSIDELLSGNEILDAAKEENRQKQEQLCGTVFGLLDISAILFFFLPLFGQRSADAVFEVSLLELSSVAPFLKTAYITAISLTSVIGILSLALQNILKGKWVKAKTVISLVTSSVGVLLFILSSQAYAATLLFIFLIIKVFLLIKNK